MKITERIVKHKDEEGVILEYVNMSQDFVDIRNYVANKGRLLTVHTQKKELLQIRLDDVLYFEAVGELVFVYTSSEVYEVSQRLYQLEEKFKDGLIRRISKSMLANLNHVISVRPALNARFYAKMVNGEELLISRQYAKDVLRSLREGTNESK